MDCPEDYSDEGDCNGRPFTIKWLPKQIQHIKYSFHQILLHKLAFDLLYLFGQLFDSLQVILGVVEKKYRPVFQRRELVFVGGFGVKNGLNRNLALSLKVYLTFEDHMPDALEAELVLISQTPQKLDSALLPVDELLAGADQLEIIIYLLCGCFEGDPLFVGAGGNLGAVLNDVPLCLVIDSRIFLRVHDDNNMYNLILI